MGTARSKDDLSTCAICGKPAVRGAVVDGKKHVDPFPFCSFRCQTIDLGKWLNEEYRIPDADGGASAPSGESDDD